MFNISDMNFVSFIKKIVRWRLLKSTSLTYIKVGKVILRSSSCKMIYI
nr:MAG TPA: hypothetical protein [Caudoviricetes sp.]